MYLYVHVTYVPLYIIIPVKKIHSWHYIILHKTYAGNITNGDVNFIEFLCNSNTKSIEGKDVQVGVQYEYLIWLSLSRI